MMSYLYRIGGSLYMSDFEERDLRECYEASRTIYPIARLTSEITEGRLCEGDLTAAHILEGGRILRKSNMIIVKPTVKELNFGDANKEMD